MFKPLLNIDENGNESNLLMIGCGPYAQKVYLPALNAFRATKDERLFLRTVLELDTKVEETRAAIDRWSVRSSTINVVGISATVEEEERNCILDSIKEEKNIDAVIISTEPSTHVDYARWALRQKLHVLMDKPISARPNASTNEEQAWKLLEDYQLLAAETISARKEKPDLAFSVGVQRRYDPDFIRLISNVKEVFQEKGQFPTTIEITKADGSLRLPRELLEEKYHGFDKGYGILSHTGYHIFDVVSQIIQIADGTPKQIEEVNVTSSFVRPSDLVNQMNPEEFKKMFHGKVEDDQIILSEEEEKEMSKMGEVDAHITIECLNKGNIMTVITIHLLHNSISARKNADEMEDKYLGAGRTKHESIDIFQGPIAHHEYTNNHATGSEASTATLGTLAHNGKKPFLTVKNKIHSFWSASLAKLFNRVLGREWKVDMPRIFMLREFVRQVKGIDQEESYSDILTHQGTVSLMAAAYASGARKFTGEDPSVTIPYKTNYTEE
jgi:predicted dehydrogenase